MTAEEREHVDYLFAPTHGEPMQGVASGPGGQGVMIGGMQNAGIELTICECSLAALAAKAPSPAGVAR